MDTRRPIFGLLLVMAAAWSSPVAMAVEDMVQIYQKAETRDPRFAGVQSSFKAVQEGRVQARARMMLPNVTAGGSAAYNRENTSIDGGGLSFGSGFSEYASRGYSINLVQPVYHYDRYRQLLQADSRIRQAQLDIDAARQDLIVRTAERYLATLTATDNLDFSRADREALSRQLEEARQRFDTGLIAITDVQEAQAGHDAAVANEIAAQKALDDTYEALYELTGEYHRQLAALGSDIPLVAPEPADADRWAETARAQNLNVAAATTAARIAAEEIKVQYAGHLPSLDLVGETGSATGGGRFGSSTTDSSSIGLQLNVPIYEGGQVQSRTRQATYQHQAALDREEEARRAAVRQARSAYSGVISGISRIEALNQAVVSAQTALEATRAGFEVGTRTSVDVVNQQRDLLRAKRDHADARYRYVLDVIKLKQAAGTLSPNDLGEINRWLMR